MSDSETQCTWIVDWWLGDARQDVSHAEARARFWYSSHSDADREIGRQFGTLIEDACAGLLAEWAETSHGALALVLLTDQFTRNVYRSTPEAFAGDVVAMATAESAIARRYDRSLSVPERIFLYHPFMHSETLSHQERSIELFTRLMFEAPSAWTGYVATSLRFAKTHKDLISRFGRFPHRNEILKRESTPVEIEFLKTAQRFGQ